jgi:carbonic anhydrase
VRPIRNQTGSSATLGLVSSTDDLLENNQKYVAAFASPNLRAEPASRIAIVACMDARLDPGRVLGLEPGDAHVIRNAGGVVTDDAIRSLTISQRLLGTEEIIVIQHTDCGMLKIRDAELEAQIEAETGVSLPFAIEALSDLDGGVRDSLDRLHGSPFLPHKRSIRGFVYEVETGRLREVI